MPERVHKVERVDVVAYLFAVVAEHDIGGISNRAFHQIGEKAVQLRSRMAGISKATAAKANSLHAKITPVFLN